MCARKIVFPQTIIGTFYVIGTSSSLVYIFHYFSFLRQIHFCWYIFIYPFLFLVFFLRSTNCTFLSNIIFILGMSAMQWKQKKIIKHLSFDPTDWGSGDLSDSITSLPSPLEFIAESVCWGPLPCSPFPISPKLGQGTPWQLMGTHEQPWEVPGARGPAGQIDGCFRKGGTVWQVVSSAEERRGSRSWSWVTWSARSSGSLPTSLPFSPPSHWGGCGPVSPSWQPAKHSLKGVLHFPCLPFQSCPRPILALLPTLPVFEI